MHVIAKKGARPGQFRMELKPSKRNSKKVDLTGTSRFGAIKAICRDVRRRASSGSLRVPTDAAAAIAMIKGVYLNGHKYSQGSHIEYFPFVSRAGDVAQGSSNSSKLATINLFYIFDDPSGAQVFVEVTEIPTNGKIRALFVTDCIDRDSARLDGFSRVPSGNTIMIHVDSIVHKIKLVPHFSDSTKMIGIRMWEAR